MDSAMSRALSLWDIARANIYNVCVCVCVCITTKSLQDKNGSGCFFVKSGGFDLIFLNCDLSMFHSLRETLSK